MNTSAPWLRAEPRTEGRPVKSQAERSYERLVRAGMDPRHALHQALATRGLMHQVLRHGDTVELEGWRGEWRCSREHTPGRHLVNDHVGAFSFARVVA